MSHGIWQGLFDPQDVLCCYCSPSVLQVQPNFSHSSLCQAKLFVMTSVSRILRIALVLSMVFANPLQQNELSQLISDGMSVGVIPNTLGELAALPDAIANPGTQYTTGDTPDHPGSTGTSWSLAGSNGSPAAKSNDIWQQPAKKPLHSITAEITFQYKQDPGDSLGSVCKANTAARLFGRSPGSFQPCCFPIEIDLILVERHPFCCEGGHVDIAPFRQNCILCMLILFPFQKEFDPSHPPPLNECPTTSWKSGGYCDAKERVKLIH